MSNEYFPHDYGARLSLRGVRKDFGLEGLGFYWCFVEILHEEGGYIKESDIENIAYDLQVKPEMCESVIRNYDLFTIKKGKIYSERVLKNIKKRADISEARKRAAEERWKGEEQPIKQEEQPDKGKPAKPTQKPIEEQFEDRQQWESFEAAIKWYREVIDEKFEEWTNSCTVMSTEFDLAFSTKELINNILDEVSLQKTLKINNRNIDSIKFLECLIKFFRDEQTRNELCNAIYEVENKYQSGEIRNKQNYLISTLWNKAQMQIV